MKTILISILIIVSVKAQAGPKQNKLSTDIQFDGHSVGGQVQAPFESLTEVENEKLIDQLIGVRKNFNDRTKKLNQLR